MRTLVVVFLAMAVFSPAFAQIEAKLIDFNNKLEIVLERDTSQHSFSNTFHSVNVIDIRDDSFAVGYHYLKPGDAIRYQIKPSASAKDKNIDKWSKVYHCSPTLSEGFNNWINAYLQCRKSTTADNKLLIVVKKFWLSPEADEIRNDNDKIGQAINGWDAGVACKLEFYLERNSMFFPLYRVDSVFTFKERLNDYRGTRFVDNAGSFVTSVLKSSLQKLADINVDEIIAKRKKLSFSDIYQAYSRKMDVPALNVINLKKGVYKTFEEFKANDPSLPEYEFRKGTAGDILYVKKEDSEYPTREVWGFCDGKDIFINSGDKYSKLERREKTFYFFGVKGMTQKTKNDFWKSTTLNYMSGYGPKKTVYKLDFKYYQIDMDTGEVY